MSGCYFSAYGAAQSPAYQLSRIAIVPPIWTPANPKNHLKSLRGEIGRLEYVLPAKRSNSNRCFLIIEHEGQPYVGCLFVDGDVFLRPVNRCAARLCRVYYQGNRRSGFVIYAVGNASTTLLNFFDCRFELPDFVIRSDCPSLTPIDAFFGLSYMLLCTFNCRLSLIDQRLSVKTGEFYGAHCRTSHSQRVGIRAPGPNAPVG